MTKSEVNRHCIRINKEIRSFFPAEGVPFQIAVGDRKVDVVLDRYDRMRLLYSDWDIMRDILNLENEMILVFSRDSDGTLRISIEK